MTTRDRHGEPGPQAIEAVLLAALQAHDPMNTGCAENEGMESEYRLESHEAAGLVAQGIPIADALDQTFEHFFGADLIDQGKKKALHMIAAQVTAAGANA